MRMHTTLHRLLLGTLVIACLALAVGWPEWRNVLAAQGYYVQVNGPVKTWVSKKASKKNPNPPFVLMAVLPTGLPSGGTFSWNIIPTGGGSVEFISASDDGSIATFRGVDPSTAPEDVEIDVEYSVNGTTASGAHAFTVLRPKSLCTCDASANPWLCGGVYDESARTVYQIDVPTLVTPYKTQYVYTVFDQFDQFFNPQAADFMAPNPVFKEILTKLKRLSKCSAGVTLSIGVELFFHGGTRTLTAYTASGIAFDELGFACNGTDQPNPPDTYWQWDQELFVADWLVSERVLSFFADRMLSQSVPSSGILCPHPVFAVPRDPPLLPTE